MEKVEEISIEESMFRAIAQTQGKNQIKKGGKSSEFVPATFDRLKEICFAKGMEINEHTTKGDIVDFWYGRKPSTFRIEEMEEEAKERATAREKAKKAEKVAANLAKDHEKLKKSNENLQSGHSQMKGSKYTHQSFFSRIHPQP